jgi:hypothetical protein
MKGSRQQEWQEKLNGSTKLKRKTCCATRSGYQHENICDSRRLEAVLPWTLWSSNPCSIFIVTWIIDRTPRLELVVRRTGFPTIPNNG